MSANGPILTGPLPEPSESINMAEVFGTVVELVQSLGSVEVARMQRELAALEHALQEARTRGDLERSAQLAPRLEPLRELIEFYETRLTWLRAAMADQDGDAETEQGQ